MTKLRFSCLLGTILLCVSLSACKTPIGEKPPIVDAGTAVGKIPGGTAGEGQTGQAVYHTVKAGESLYKIASQYGCSWQDLAQWNNISDPSKLSIGQQLRVSATGGAATTTASSGGVEQPTTTAIKPADVRIEDRMQWAWPAKGQVIAKFDEKTNKGINISGSAGDPIYSAADGRVAYVGEYRSYGKLVIVKHNDVFLTAYAHNRKILVEENQVVKKGEKIAEMGDTDASRVMLHFEIRQLNPNGTGGSTVDPLKYLPTR